MRWLRAIASTLALTAGGGLGCAALIGLEEGVPEGAGGGGGTAVSTVTTTTASTATTGGGECVNEGDCPDPMNECVTRTCTSGACGTTNVSAGSPVSVQVAGNCKKAVCNGNGATVNEDDDDPLDDGNPCSDDACDSGVPANTWSAVGEPCSVDSGVQCDGKGVCVQCLVTSECSSLVCEGGNCLDATCVDGVKNGAETDVDCGGGCGLCKDGKTCGLEQDCTSGVCSGSVCQPPTCSDGVQNGDELDVDCAGVCPKKCGFKQKCATNADCIGGVCSGTLCVGTCNDGAKNQDESDVDCGGLLCAGCLPGDACVYGADCKSNSCIGQLCQATCADGAKNAAETDVDCGGGTCPKCLDTKACSSSTDCVSPYCVAGFCASTACGSQCGAACVATCGDGTCAPAETCGSCAVDCACGLGLCGNGVVDVGEECEDQNQVSTDLCSNQCLAQHVLVTALGMNAPAGPIAYVGQGTVVATWRELIGGSTDTRMRRLSLDGVALDPSAITVNTATAGYQQERGIYAEDDGIFTLTWYTGEPSGNVVGRRFLNGCDAAPLTPGDDLFGATAFASSGGPFDGIIAQIAPGTMVVAWSSFTTPSADTNGTAVFFRRFTSAGAPIDAAPILANTTTPGNQPVQSIAALDGGGFVVAWGDASNADGQGADGVRARIFSVVNDVVLPIGADFALNADASGDQFNARVARLPGKGFVSTWQDVDSVASKEVRYRRFSPLGVPLDATDQTANTTTTGYQNPTDVVSNAIGDFLILWDDGAGNDVSTMNDDARGRMFDSFGQPLTQADVLVSSSSLGYAGGARATALPSRDFAVMYNQNGSYYLRKMARPPTGTPVWTKRFGDANDQVALSVADGGLGTVVLSGAFAGNLFFGSPQSSAGGNDLFVAKVDASGTPLWTRGFGDAVEQSWSQVAADAAGNVVVAGTFKGTVNAGGAPMTSAGNYDVFLAKLSPGNTHLWSKRLGGGAAQRAYAVTTDGAGNVIATGYCSGDTDFGGGILACGASWDAFVVKLDASGNHLWSKRFGDDPTIDVATGVAVDSAGNVMVSGWFTSGIDFGGGVLTAAGGSDAFLAKFDASGNPVWSKQFGGVAAQAALGIAADGKGRTALVGRFAGTIDFGNGALQSSGGDDVFVATFDPSGAPLWNKRFGDSDVQIGEGVAMDAAGSVVISGFLLGAIDFGGGSFTSAGGLDLFAAKFDASGNHLWSKRLGDAADQSQSAVAFTKTGDVWMAGGFKGSIDFGGGALLSNGGADGFLARLTP